MEPILNKGKALYTIYSQENDIATLKKSQATFQIGIDFINYVFSTFKEGKSVQLFFEEFYGIYEGAIKVNLALYQENKDEKYLKEAFTFAEQSKGVVHFEHLQASNAKIFSGIPNELLRLEDSLKLKIANLEQMQFKEENKTSAKNDSLLAVYKGRIYRCRKYASPRALQKQHLVLVDWRHFRTGSDICTTPPSFKNKSSLIIKRIAYSHFNHRSKIKVVTLKFSIPLIEINDRNLLAYKGPKVGTC